MSPKGYCDPYLLALQMKDASFAARLRLKGIKVPKEIYDISPRVAGLKVQRVPEGPCGMKNAHECVCHAWGAVQRTWDIGIARASN